LANNLLQKTNTNKTNKGELSILYQIYSTLCLKVHVKILLTIKKDVQAVMFQLYLHF